MLGDQLRRGGVHRLEVGEVDLERGHVHPVTQLPGEPRQAAGVAIEQDGRCGVLGEQAGELRAQASRRTRDERLREPPFGPQARRRATDKRGEPGGRPAPGAPPPLVPRLDVEELDAEALLVVDVDDGPGPEPQRWTVWAPPRLEAASVRRLELRAVSKPERDVEQALVRD